MCNFFKCFRKASFYFWIWPFFRLKKVLSMLSEHQPMVQFLSLAIPLHLTCLPYLNKSVIFIFYSFGLFSVDKMLPGVSRLDNWRLDSFDFGEVGLVETVLTDKVLLDIVLDNGELCRVRRLRTLRDISDDVDEVSLNWSIAEKAVCKNISIFWMETAEPNTPYSQPIIIHRQHAYGILMAHRHCYNTTLIIKHLSLTKIGFGKIKQFGNRPNILLIPS